MLIKIPRTQLHIISRQTSVRRESEPVMGRLFYPVAATDDISVEEHIFFLSPSVNPPEDNGKNGGGGEKE